jgi:hypothetical protein
VNYFSQRTDGKTMTQQSGNRCRTALACRGLICVLFFAGQLVASDPARAAESTQIVTVLGEELKATWAQCPFALWVAQRKANRELSLDLAGSVVLMGDAAPRVEYHTIVGRAGLHVTIAASMKSHELMEWHAPDTEPRNRHEIQIEASGLSASIKSPDLQSRIVSIFKEAVESCMGIKRAS